MSRVASVRAFAAHEWRIYRQLRLRALADAPDAFGSTLAAERDHPDEHWSVRLAFGAGSSLDLPLVAEVGGEPVGLTWARIDPAQQVAHLFQMWVDPAFRGAGAGGKLLETAIAWAAGAGARAVLLRVTCGDTPATRLYARAGFAPAGDPEPIRPGSALLAQPLRLELRADGREHAD
jgi:GNAT superfamily N-acetyltransferase